MSSDENDLETVDYRGIVEQSAESYLIVLADPPKFTMVAASQMYLQTLAKRLDEIVGKGVFEVFPGNTPEEEKTLYDSFNAVVLTNKRYDASIFKYAVPTADGEYENRYWSLVYFPIFNREKRLEHIVQRVEDITEFVRLQEATQEQTHTISKMETEVFRRAQQIKDTNKELKTARDEAVKANELKNMFIANVSHELRTPLSAIIGYAELLSDTTLDDEQRTSVHLLRQAAEIQLSIVNDLLDISKIEAGKMTAELTEFQLWEMLRQTVDGFRIIADKKHIALTLQIMPQVPDHVLADRRHLHQVLYNLIGNALKFTLHGSVTINVTLAGDDRIRFEVADTGIGIPLDKQGELFTPFYQADSGDTRRFGGTGLGLAISKQLVEMMDGTIGFTSEADRGSTFYIELPVKRAASTSTAADTPHHWTATDLTPFQSKRVLVVEDNDLIRTLVKNQLRKLGMTNVEIVADGLQGVEAFKHAPPDIVLMDIQMPVMDGYTATQEIRLFEQETNRKRTPIVAMTASIMHSERQRCYDAGMDDILGKPVVLSALANTLVMHMSQHTT